MNWVLRIELWNNNINIPPNITTNIKNVNKYLKKAMNEVSSKMPGWKYLNRVEASISTDNEERQIRERKNNNTKINI